MKLAITGLSGVGSSTTARLVAQKFNLPVNNFTFRDLAKEWGMTFEEMQAPVFTHEPEWNLEQLLAYIGTWSAVKHFREKTGADPVDLIRAELKQAWGELETRKVSFPILLRIGKTGTE